MTFAGLMDQMELVCSASKAMFSGAENALLTPPTLLDLPIFSVLLGIGTIRFALNALLEPYSSIIGVNL